MELTCLKILEPTVCVRERSAVTVDLPNWNPHYWLDRGQVI